MIIIGKTYRFKSVSTRISDELLGKKFKILSDKKLEVYNSDGSIIMSQSDNPYFIYTSHPHFTLAIDWSWSDDSFKPLTHVGKHIFVV